jgi:hypothetical protein
MLTKKWALLVIVLPTISMVVGSIPVNCNFFPPKIVRTKAGHECTDGLVMLKFGSELRFRVFC